MSVLTVRHATASWTYEHGWFRRKVERRTAVFEDFVVDGTALTERFGSSESDVTPLSLEDAESAAFAVQLLDALLGERDGLYKDGCSPLIICGIDFDAYCGALGVRADFDDDQVRWTFGWHRLDGDGSVEGHATPDEAQPASFSFKRSDYEALLRTLRDQYRNAADGSRAVPFLPPA